MTAQSSTTPHLTERGPAAAHRHTGRTARHDATRGDYTGLDAIVAAERQNQAAEADELSQGLHASTMCEDLHGPWGDAATPVAGRAAATVAAVAGLSDAAVSL
jgi:hypothetical protein